MIKMNPGNYPNVPGPGMGPQNEPQKNGRGSISAHVTQILQQQQIPPGWQSTVPVQQRLPIVVNLISSLRLIKPDMDITQHISIAINYELKVFLSSADQASYDQACRSKLSDIAQTRTRQAVNIQEQLRNPPPPQMNMMQPQIQMQGTPSGHNPLQFQFTGNANPQLQPPMQASGLPLPQPFMHQQPQLPMGGQQIGMQHVSHGPHPQLPPNPSYQLTVEDNQTIQRMAHNLAISTPSDQLDIIRSNLENMQPDQRQFLAQQNIDPMTYFFRNHATRKFLEQKARMAGQRAPHDVNLSGNGIMPQPPRAPPQMQSHPGHPSQVPPSQMVDPSFGGNMDQIRGQQEDALRSQEAGQVVVPASQQRGNVRNTPHPQPNALLGGSQVLQNLNQALPVAAQYWGTPQIPQGHMQPGQPPAQPQTATFVNMSTPTQLQGQVGGLNSHMGRMPHQTPNMPNLNKGLKDSPQTQNRWHNQPPPPNQPPGQAALGVPQPKPQPGVSLEMDANQQRQMNHRLANMPPDQRREILMNMQRRQRPASQANAHVPESATAKPPENQAGQQIPVQDVSSTPMMNNADGAHDPAMPQQPPAIAVPGPQQAQSQRSQHVARQNAQVAHLANILTEEQAQQMDQREFPITILNHAVTLSHLPPNIKTWGQLKGWISQKNNELPPGVLGKIRLLQVLHFQNLAKQNNPAQQIPQSSTSNVPGLIRPSAPTAPMVPARNNGQPFQAGNGPGVAQGPRIMGGPPVPQPTVQEIQACRARLPDHLHGLTDEQISIMIFRQRQDLIKSQAQHPLSMQHMSNPNRQRVYPPNMPPQQFPAPNNQPIPLVQPAHRPQHQQTPRPAGNMAKEQQPKQPSANRNLPQTQNQGQSKGTKRSSSDDVVEVANPSSIRKETQVHPTQAQTSAQSKAKVHHNIPDQSAAVHPAKHPVKAEQGVPTHPTAPDFQSQPSTQDARSRTQLDAEQRKRLQQLATETAQSMPARQPISMSPEIKAKMTQKLRDARAMVQRLDHALPIFFRLFGDETIAKDLIRIRLLLVGQYRGPEYNPIDQFTISAEELDGCLDKLNKYFHKAKLVQQKGSISAQGQPVSQQHVGTQSSGGKAPLPTESAPTLSAANLQEHQKAMQVQRQASLQKNHAGHGGNRAPAAPTSPQPPFHFGSPDGVPAKYANRTDELTQERLRIPPKKKRKGDQTSNNTSIPAQPQPSSTSKSPQPAKIASSLTPRVSNDGNPFKCHVPDCPDQLNGFASQADLDRHVTEIHEPKEVVIDDPLQWTLEQMRSGLGLDENGKPKPLHAEAKPEKHVAEAARMKKSPSGQGQAAVKQESSTPMTRVPTQTGPSPGSNLLKTPQASASANAKTPLSEAKSNPRDAKATDSENSNFPIKDQASTLPDPWATSFVGPAAVHGAFSGLASLHSTGNWSTIQHVLTPPSTLSSGMSERTSPRVSDISENDAVKINLNSDPLDYFDWSTFESATLDDYPNDSDYDQIEGMDWEMAGFDGLLKEVENGGARERRLEDMGPSQEWLTVFAPESLHKKS